ncbi:MAG TPA: MarR family transcriptional regulator [Thermoleophilaceae bacterium]|jgi:DNA-binding MarR family transcriptional regulator
MSSSSLPSSSARAAPENLAILLREPFRVGTEVLHRRFAERGHPEIRPVHGNVMQFLDDEGTRVSVLAERAQVTKQSMAELVAHLERLGYVERVPDPSDRRAKLVRATARGKELYAIAREVVAELEAEWTRRLGRAKMRDLRALLEELNAGL